MAEFEEKFQEILGNETAMSQIMAMAQSLSVPQEDNNPTGIEDFVGGLDPKMMAIGMKLLTAYQNQHRSIELMSALRPFVKEERHVTMDRLAQASKLAKVVACFLEMLKEKGGDSVV